MATYLYCVLGPAKTDAFPSGLRGIAGAPVRSVIAPTRSGIEAWVATIEDSILRSTGRELAEQALLHNAVVDAALATGRTPLPARFGSRFRDDAACASHLEEHRAKLEAALTRVSGAVEMAVLLVPTAESGETLVDRPQRGEPDAGRRYLEAIRERTQSVERLQEAADRLARRLGSTVARMVRGEARRSDSSSIVSVAHLVDRADLDRYRRAVAGLTTDNDFKIVVAGPRAPYSFAAESTAIVGHDSSSPNHDE
jgi:hypothetical protein